MTTKLPPPFRHSPGSPEYAGLPAADPKVQPDPDAPDDYAPLPDAMQQLDPVTETFQVLRAHFWGRPGVLTHGNSPVYYLDEEERQRLLYPRSRQGPRLCVGDCLNQYLRERLGPQSGTSTPVWASASTGALTPPVASITLSRWRGRHWSTGNTTR